MEVAIAGHASGEKKKASLSNAPGGEERTCSLMGSGKKRAENSLKTQKKKVKSFKGEISEVQALVGFTKIKEEKESGGLGLYPRGCNAARLCLVRRRA